jgi:Amt family ammonium transporter
MRPILLIIFGIGTLLLRAGFALQVSGSLRSKNAAAMIVRTIADTAAAALAFWAFGAAILFQTRNGWIGFDTRFFFHEPPDFAATEFFHMTLCLIGSAIVTGALAERSKFYAGVITSAVLGGLVFPIAGHCIWFGQLHELNFIDFGGATAIHLSGAIFAAIGVAVLGSRSGKFNRDGSSNSIAGHSLPMLGIGALLLFAGWFPYLIGCVCAHWTPPSSLDEVVIGIAATNILLAAAGGVVGGLLYSHQRYRKPDLFFVFSGVIAGLVAISAGLAAVNNPEALLIGFVAGIIAPIVATHLDTSAHLDDPLGLIAIHGTSAIWGTLAAALFVPTTYMPDHLKLLAIQAGGVVGVIVLSSVVALPLFLVLRKLNMLRSTTADEISGHDLGEHDVHAYPDSLQEHQR